MIRFQRRARPRASWPAAAFVPVRLLCAGLVAFSPGVAGACSSHSAMPVTAYVGATLIDGTGAEAIAGGVMLVRDGRLECVGTADECPVPAGAERIDLTGSWVTPGLIDAHVHYAQTGWADGRPDGMDVTDRYRYDEVVAAQRRDVSRTYRSYLCAGVTATFDVGGFPWSWELRDDDTQVTIRAGGLRLPAPHVAAAGPLLTWVPARMSLPAEQVMIHFRSEQQARDAAHYIAANGSDALKVWFLTVPDRAGGAAAEPDGPSRQQVDAWVAAIAEQAAAAEPPLPLIVHATSLREAKVALRAGARVLVHSVQDTLVDEEFLALAREAGAIYTPTLGVGENWWAMARAAFFRETPAIDDPNGCVDPATRAKVLSTPEYHDRPYVARFTTEQVAARDAAIARRNEIMAENLRRVIQADIPVALGTDAGNPFTLHGVSVYAEMERMQRAGMTPPQVLLAATRNAARAMARAAEIGTLEAGKVADFIVLGADPLRDVAAFRSVQRVARAGVLVPVTALSYGR